MQIIQELPNLADKMQKATQSHAIWQMWTIVAILFSICMLLLSFHFLGKDDKSIREDPWSFNKFKNICVIVFLKCYKVCYNLATRW